MRIWICLVGLAILTVVGASPAVASPSSPGTSSPSGGLAYSGEAYGSYIRVGGAVVSGKSAPASFIGQDPGVHRSNTLATVHLPGLLGTGVIDSSLDSAAANGNLQARSSNDIHDVNVLNGLITASTLASTSVVSGGASGFRTSADGSDVVRLTVAGRRLDVAPPPNTTIPLPGIGRVVLNEQLRSVDADGASLEVNMVHVYVTVAQRGVAAGTQIILAHARSGIGPSQTVAPTLCGRAYATSAQVAGVATSGPSWPAQLCVGNGTQSGASTNSALGLNITRVVSTGTLEDTVSGSSSSTRSDGEASSTIQRVNLLDGLLTADVIRADVKGSETPGGLNLQDGGSSLVNVAILGRHLDPDIAPNTVISLGPLTLTLHRVIRSATGITVHMVELTVSGPNRYNLPVGSDIQVATAELAAR